MYIEVIMSQLPNIHVYIYIIIYIYNIVYTII